MKNKKLHTIALILAGNFLTAMAVTFFIAPNNIILGGSTGVSLIITHFFPIPLSWVVLSVNMLLFGLGTLFLGKKFALSTIASSVLYPFMMSILELFPLPLQPGSDTTMLAAVFGGVLMGSGVGLILRSGGSTGGSDVIALILHKFTHISLSALLYAVDGCILAAQLVFSETIQILYGLVVLALITLTMNRIMCLGKTKIQLFIISDRINDIRRKILTDEDGGLTMVSIERGYTRQSDKGILCLIPRRKLYSISEMISAVDPGAFWTVSEVNEIRGQGFTYDMRP